jgi:hypothetical protein
MLEKRKESPFKYAGSETKTPSNVPKEHFLTISP